SVRGADLILALDDGRAAGLGPHEELLRQSPTYAEICRLSGDEAGEAAAGAPVAADAAPAAPAKGR
ncbi:MAG: ABC transporter ATP-binding protein, partial [Clostridia bacterium]|nr:ABC transporter ATP-binding protein [Clostridia bacterium]